MSSPLLAGIISSGGKRLYSTSTELSLLYTFSRTAFYGSVFRDIGSGIDGTFSAVPGYDLATGLGSPKNPKGF